MIRATASSPFDKPHLRTLNIGRDPLQKQNLKDLHKRALPPDKLGRDPPINESDENTRTLLHHKNR
jgi:hypothetical protein